MYVKKLAMGESSGLFTVIVIINIVNLFPRQGARTFFPPSSPSRLRLSLRYYTRTSPRLTD